MKICFIGTGYVGLVSGVLFSDLGNTVTCVDNNHEKIENLKNGIIPIFEPGLEELVIKNYNAKRLFFTTDINNAIKNSDIIFIAVGTPTAKDGISADLKNVYAVAQIISKNINKFKIIDEHQKVSFFLTCRYLFFRQLQFLHAYLQHHMIFEQRQLYSNHLH